MNLKLSSVRYPIEVLALEALAAGGALRDPLGVDSAPLPIIEEYPGVLSLDLPVLPPDLLLLFAWTI